MDKPAGGRVPQSPDRSWLAESPLAALAVFVIVTAVYLINPDPLWSGDMNSNTIFAFNLLEFHTIHLDAFANSHVYKAFGGYSFAPPLPNIPAGPHYSLSYPVGTAVVTLPLYVLFYTYLKVFAPAVSLMSAEFEPYRLAFSHIAAAVTSAATVALFFLIARARFAARSALIATACLAFATMQWGLLSQSLYQQGPSSFVVIASAYLLLRAEVARRPAWLLLASGALTGLLFMIRPTGLVFMLVLLIYAVFRSRLRSWPFIVGIALTTAMSVAWNWFYFSSWIGAAAFYQAHSYFFTLETFVAAFSGLTFSPNHGVFVNSAVLIFSLAGFFLALRAVARAGLAATPGADVLFILLLGAAGVLLLSYSFSPFWDAGGGYGTRYLSETMPIVAYFLNFLPSFRGRPIVATAFGLCFALGVFNQVTAIVGGHTAFGGWAGMPYGTNDLPEDRRWAYMHEAPLKSFQTRRWDIRDGLDARIWRGVYSRHYLMPMTNATAARQAGCRATILSIEDNAGRPFGSFSLKSVDTNRAYADMVWDLFSEGRKFVHVRIRNDGTVPLYGYQTGLTWGYTAMAYKVIAPEGRVVREAGTVYVSGVINPGETGDALGNMEIAIQKGHYRVEARIAVSGLGLCGPEQDLGTIDVE